MSHLVPEVAHYEVPLTFAKPKLQEIIARVHPMRCLNGRARS